MADDIFGSKTRKWELNGLAVGMKTLGVRDSLLLTAKVEETIAVEAGNIILPLWKWLTSGDVGSLYQTGTW